MLLLIPLFCIASLAMAAPGQVLYLSPVHPGLGLQPVLQPVLITRALSQQQQCGGTDFACIFQNNLNQTVTQIQTQGQQGFDMFAQGFAQGFDVVQQGFQQGFQQVSDGTQSWAPGNELVPASTMALKPDENKPIDSDKKPLPLSRSVYAYATYPLLQYNPFGQFFGFQPLQEIKVARSLGDPKQGKNDKFEVQDRPNILLTPAGTVPLESVPVAEPLKSLIAAEGELGDQVPVHPVDVIPIVQSRSEEIQSDQNVIKEEPVVKYVEAIPVEVVPAASPLAAPAVAPEPVPAPKADAAAPKADAAAVKAIFAPESPAPVENANIEGASKQEASPQASDLKSSEEVTKKDSEIEKDKVIPESGKPIAAL